METFELYRFSLIERRQQDLYDQTQAMTREQCLRFVFDQRFSFIHRSNEFHYVPNESSEVIIGKVGREKLIEENTPPSEGLADLERMAWHASVIVIDPSDNEDGQKLAMQWIDSVGKPNSVLKSMIGAINEIHPNLKYSFELDQIVDVSNFWEFVRQNSGKITQITFDVPVPNMFGSQENWDQDLRDARDKQRAKRVKVTYTNDDGQLDPETDRIREAVDYTDRSSGKIAARAKGKASFNSSSSNKITQLKVNDDQTVLQAISTQIQRILGRE